MYYFWVENLSNPSKSTVCVSQALRSTQQTQGRDSIHMDQGIKRMFGEIRNANQYVTFFGCFGTYYELQQILPKTLSVLAI